MNTVVYAFWSGVDVTLSIEIAVAAWIVWIAYDRK
jgi:hypothetical protein